MNRSLGRTLSAVFVLVSLLVLSPRVASAWCGWTEQQSCNWTCDYGYDEWGNYDYFCGDHCQSNWVQSCDTCGNGQCDEAAEQSICPADCQSTNRVIYIHGSEFSTWPSYAFLRHSPAWTDVAMYYDGNARLDTGSIRQTIRDTLINNCATSTPNQCVLISASAGSPRLLLALSDIRAQYGDNALRIAWQGHYASAEGGSELADAWTHGWRKYLSKINGSDAPIHHDLSPSRMRNDFYWIHYEAQQPVYMAAGNRDEVIKKFLFWKIKGNTHMPCQMGDGKVPVHSAGGYAYAGCNFSMCDGTPKYPNRTAYQCPLTPTQHLDTIADGLVKGSTDLGYTPYFASCDVGDDSSEPEADPVSADSAAQGPATYCEMAGCLTGGQAVCQTPLPSRSVMTGPGTLAEGRQLLPNESITSEDGRFMLAYQGDGNLVLYQLGVRALWASNTVGAAGFTAMQGDGNLVVYTPWGQPRWATGTTMSPGAFVLVQNDGNMVVYSKYMQPVWGVEHLLSLSMSRQRKLGVGALVLVCAIAALVWWRMTPGRQPARADAARPGAAAGPAAPPGPRRGPMSSLPSAPRTPGAAAQLPALPPGPPTQLADPGFAADNVARTKALYAEYAIFPPWSRPADASFKSFVEWNAPRTVENVDFARDPGGAQVSATLELDRMYARPDETVTALLQVWKGAATAPEAVAFDARGELQLWDEEAPNRPGDSMPAVAAIGFDRVPGQPTRMRARFTPSKLGALAGHSNVAFAAFITVPGKDDRPQLRPLVLELRYTTREPVTIIDKVADRIDGGGALLVEFDLDVHEVAPIHIGATLFDRTGKDSIAIYNDYYRPKQPGRQRAAIRFFGKILRDRNIDGPYLIKLHGHSIDLAKSPPETFWRDDRDFTTASYSATAFSSAPWDDAAKRDQLELYDRMQKGFEQGKL